MATLGNTKDTVYLTNDEGYDIKLQDLDFADVGDYTCLEVTEWMQDYLIIKRAERLSGTEAEMFDTSYDGPSSGQSAGYADPVIVSGQVIMHSSTSFTATTAYGDGDDGLFDLAW